MNIIYGLYHQDEGEVLIHGEPVHLGSPRDAIERGVGMVHQHFQLVQPMTVAENIILGSKIMQKNGVFIDIDEARARVAQLSEQYGLEVDPDAVIEKLPVGVQQRVEILKALYRRAKILILDEPTAVLTPREIDDLFRVMRELVAQGHSIIFITHKLKEVLEVAHRIVVIRDGHVVGSALPEESIQASLASMMVGREVILKVPKGPAHPGESVLWVDVGSIEFIHGRIVEQRDNGVAVLLVSAELDEIMALSDRIVVMYKGEIIGEVEASGATREQLGLLMAGVHPDENSTA